MIEWWLKLLSGCLMWSGDIIWQFTVLWAGFTVEHHEWFYLFVHSNALYRFYKERANIWSLMACLRSLQYTQINESLEGFFSVLVSFKSLNNYRIVNAVDVTLKRTRRAQLPVSMVLSAQRDLTPVPAFTLFAKLNSYWFDLCHFEYFFFFSPSPLPTLLSLGTRPVNTHPDLE